MHWWHPSDAVTIQLLVVGGYVVNGLFQAYNRFRARQWEREDRLMRVKAATERKSIEDKIDVTSATTMATANQVAEAHGVTLEEMIAKAKEPLRQLMERYGSEGETSAEAKARHWPRR
jgi:hypothetical protein